MYIMSNNSWKQYGGIYRTNKFHNFSIGTLVAERYLSSTFFKPIVANSSAVSLGNTPPPIPKPRPFLDVTFKKVFAISSYADASDSELPVKILRLPLKREQFPRSAYESGWRRRKKATISLRWRSVTYELTY